MSESHEYQQMNNIKYNLYKMSWSRARSRDAEDENRLGDTVGHGDVRVRAQSCPTLCDPTHCDTPGSSVHGIIQARILERVAISSRRESS